jgi:hypothetical protein
MNSVEGGKMQSHRFNLVARVLAEHRTRRSTLRGAGLLSAGAIMGRPMLTSAQDTPAGTPGAPPEIATDPHPSADEEQPGEYLFLQPFGGGTWTPDSSADGLFTLSLSSVPGNTVYFSDRPERDFGFAPMQPFLDSLGFTPANPPNAALVATVPETGEQELLVVELLAPTYDAEAGTLTYQASVLADYGGSGLRNVATQQTDYLLPEQFGEGGLFIDDCPDNQYDCYGPDGSYVGWVNVGMCWHGVSCETCHSPEGYCGSAFPGVCVERIYDNNGNFSGIAYLCTTEDTGAQQ